MEKILQKVQSLGFNQYEAKAYVALVYLGTSSAYQVSKQSGVPRARIYEVLEGLEKMGVVMKEEVNEAAQYSPLPVDVFLESIKQKWEDTYTSVQQELKEVESQRPKADPRVTTIKGEETILSFCRILLRRAQSRIIISMWDTMYGKLEEDLQEMQKTCSLKGIVFQVKNPLPNLVIHRKTDYVDNIGEKKWFIISIDGKEMIYGHPVEQNGNTFYTDDSVHVSLLENYIWHDVLVNRLMQESKDNLQPWISVEREKFFCD
ncbi:TrmB family transcriptional regulator [Bacillus sp. WLY-B-L8]|uniref:TrmB family transcriptional regulator n=1 Tax=Bacillus multifaciens TaxID=3068506 RepID=UPI002740F059|nr:helix-turn-helix domain-containing protein [Bacillus sp. WLY-B-L8]MDP7978732.1 helix-turn-helix domain-containing protein [Bacillus sp. WLY-B-L8]